MTVTLTAIQEERLQRLAVLTDRTPDEVAQEAIDHFLAWRESWAVAVREGEESAERDGWVPHEEVVARIDRFLRSTREARLDAARRG